MTLPLLNQARHVLFLVSGGKNQALLEQVLAGDAAVPRRLGSPQKMASSPG